MNFYRHYIGDFQRDTGHLSLAERGAYRALMDYYYATERAIPNDLDALCRVAGAVNPQERKAVKGAMGMFEVRDGLLWHKRIEAELEKAGERSDTNREIALAREARKRAEKEAQKGSREEHEQSTNRGQDVQRIEHEESTKPLTSKKPIPFPNGNGASPGSEDPVKQLFDTGVSILSAGGVEPKHARSLVAKLRQTVGDVEAFSVLASARDKTSPAEWVGAAISQREKAARIDKNGQFQAVV